MRNIKIILEYEGTRYQGWQIQKNGPTVQGVLIGAIRKLTGEEVSVAGASRTDAGVHALGQTANFRTSTNIPLEGIQRGLNSILPADIVVREAVEAGPGFDARRDARSKTYLYRVLSRPCRPAIERRFVWHIPRALDLGAMKEAAAHFPGRRDFSSFRAAGSDAPHSVREIISLDVMERGGGFIDIRVRGTAFLRHMVRIITGTLVTVGLGRLTPDDVRAIIEARDRRVAPVTAPPGGLFLVEVEY